MTTVLITLFLSLSYLIMSPEGIGEGVEREDCVQALSGQIFMGMVSSQYQARLDTVRLIDALVTACIRFVYFSMEDELRSKVNTHAHSRSYINIWQYLVGYLGQNHLGVILCA